MRWMYASGTISRRAAVTASRSSFDTPAPQLNSAMSTPSNDSGHISCTVSSPAGTCPQPIREQLYKILFRPDKNAPEYKAVVEASRATHLAPLDLLQKAGAIDSAYQFHWKRFLFENFPKGTGFPAVTAPAIADELPLSTAQAYSIDDSQTTEIDDALSVQGLGTGTVVLGIHIAAPGLAIQPGSAIDQLGRARLSTVYMPGYKITMLPDDVVQTYTLDEGRANPAVSLYVTIDEATLEFKGSETKLEDRKSVV